MGSRRKRRGFDEVVSGVAQHAGRPRLGAGLDPESQLGPLVSLEQQQRVSGCIRTGTEEGAEVVAGGKPVDADGYYVPPTV